MESLNYAFDKGEFSSSQTQAVITLIERKGRDKRFLKNWRPISLLSMDTKILSKALSTHKKKLMVLLLHVIRLLTLQGGT